MMRSQYVVFGSLTLLLLCLIVEPSLAQPLPDSLRQPVSVSVVAPSDLQPHIQQYLQLYLIEAEAELVQENAVWELHLQATEREGENSVVALSLVVTQPVSPSLFGLDEPAAKTPTTDNPGSGEWIKAYLAKESWKHVSMVQQHEVVLVASEDLEAGCAELISRFQEQQLAPIHNQFLQQRD